jgi:hypothetical protein
MKKRINLGRIASIIAFALVAMLGTAGLANAQAREKDRDSKNKKKSVQKESWDKNAGKRQSRNIGIKEGEWDHRQVVQKSGNDRSNGNGYYNGNANANANRGSRYRVIRGGSYYKTDYRGTALLRQAVNEGYRQGFNAGRNDRNRGHNRSWSNFSVYRSGNYGYQRYVSQSQYRYYFRQGFERGYRDGVNSRFRDGYDDRFDYGYRQNGSLNVIGTVLDQILRIERY